jgi:hypothetical protein
MPSYTKSSVFSDPAYWLALGAGVVGIGAAAMQERNSDAGSAARMMPHDSGSFARAATFKEGDIVKHKGSFLKSISWYTDVPKNGKVLSVKKFGERALLEVKWSNGHTSKILDANVMHAGKPDYSNL